MPKLGNNLHANGNLITNLANPVSAQDAVTKSYADALSQGLSPKNSVHMATTANITLTGLQTIDGVVGIAGDRVLVKDQTTQSANGIYVQSAGAWSRAVDADQWNELVSAFVFVEEGTVNADTSWLSTVNQGGTLNTTVVTWTPFGRSYSAGTGLTLSGTVFSITAGGVTATELANNAVTTAKILDGNVTLAKLAANSVDSSKIVDGSITGSDIATGTITSGNIQDGGVATGDIADGAITAVKQADGSTTTAKIADANVTLAKLAPNSVDASKIVDGSVGDAELAVSAVNLAGTKVTSILPISKGGTNSNTGPGARINLGATGFYQTGTHAAGTSISITAATHGLTEIQSVAARETTTGNEIWPDVVVDNTTKNVTLTFSTSQGANSITTSLVGN